VGDAFAGFCRNKLALTVSQLEALLKLPPEVIPGRKRLILGQGVNEQECRSIIGQLNETPALKTRFDVSDLEAIAERAPSSLSHKRKSVNTLIGAPRQIAPGHYVLRLMVDERSELMGDHQTGQHLQGMILIEAMRQSFLAVTEAFHPLPSSNDTYFVINSMDFTFEKFLFPIPAELHYLSVQADTQKQRARHTAEVRVIQNGQVCATAQLKFAVYPNHVISEKEAEMAHSVTADFLRQAQTARRYAFFDVDDTIIAIKSMFDFARHWFLTEQNEPHQFAEFERSFAELRARGENREGLNRTYYHFFAGVRLAELEAAGRRWFAGLEASRPDLFNQPVVEALQRHQAEGVEPVFVSGSCLPLLRPLAERLAVGHILCAPLIADDDGVLTGGLGHPQTIGEGKKQAILEFLAGNGGQAEACFAYGDDISDLPMLECVGRPVAVVVEEGPLAAIATSRNWDRLSPRHSIPVPA
jgi:HAD superfamily hydrolase (TIGR01490 family)